MGCGNLTRRGSGRCHVHRWADRGDRLPTPGPPDAVRRADALTTALRDAFGPGLRSDVTALPSGAVDATVVHGPGAAAVLVSPDGGEWSVSVDRSATDDPAAGPDHVVTSPGEVVAVLRAYWPAG